MKVIVTGGAGFIGSHVVDALVQDGDEVVVFDACTPPAHLERPAWTNGGATYVWSDPRTSIRWRTATAGADVVVHLAALTGTGQSMYEVSRYTDANGGLTAWIAEELIHGRLDPGRIVYASTRAVYGDGVGWCEEHRRTPLARRSLAELAAGRWDPPCRVCGRAASPVPLREDDPVAPLTPYALSKLYGERVLTCAADVTGVPVSTLRLFNVYGPRQLPSNPYVGVVSTFARALLDGRAVELYEDGRIIRDFVSVNDVRDAIVATVRVPDAVHGVLNIGSGAPTSLRALATALAHACGLTAPRIEVTGIARAGDPRSVVADISHARDRLGWRPTWTLQRGATELVGWLCETPDAHAGPGPAQAADELRRLGLLVEAGP